MPAFGNEHLLCMEIIGSATVPFTIVSCRVKSIA